MGSFLLEYLSLGHDLGDGASSCQRCTALGGRTGVAAGREGGKQLWGGKQKSLCLLPAETGYKHCGTVNMCSALVQHAEVFTIPGTDDSQKLIAPHRSWLTNASRLCPILTCDCSLQMEGSCRCIPPGRAKEHPAAACVVL